MTNSITKSDKGNIINDWKLLIQYNIKNGDNLELIKSKGKIKIFLQDSSNNSMGIKVYLDEEVSVLNDYISYIIGISDPVEFLFNGMILMDNDTFYDMDIREDSRIVYLGHFLAGCSKMKNKKIMKFQKL